MYAVAIPRCCRVWKLFFCRAYQTTAYQSWRATVSGAARPRRRRVGPLPYPVLLDIHPYRLPCWGWLMERTSGGQVRIAVKHSGTYREFWDPADAVRFCAEVPRAGITVTESDVATSASNASVWINGARVPLCDVGEVGRSTQHPMTQDYNSTCTRDEPPPPHVTMETPGVTRRPNNKRAAVPRKRPEKATSERPVSPVPSHSKNAYKLHSIGGNREEVKRIHDARPEWDSEMVEYMISEGARMPIDSIQRTLYRGDVKHVECTVVHPTGKLVPSIYVPLDLMMFAYRELMRPFV